MITYSFLSELEIGDHTIDLGADVTTANLSSDWHVRMHFSTRATEETEASVLGPDVTAEKDGHVAVAVALCQSECFILTCVDIGSMA